MSSRTIAVTLLWVSIQSVCCYSQSLISKLPADGVWASYDMVGETTLASGGYEKIHGEFILRCVGTELDNTEKLRWIELEQKIRIKGEIVTIIDKMLIPEDKFGAGQNPVTHLRKLWRHHSQTDSSGPVSIPPSSPDAKIISAFLPPPFELKQKLDDKKIDAANRHWNCSGLSGVRVEKQARHEVEYHRTFVVFSSKESPFGTVTFRQTAKSNRRGKKLATMSATLTLKNTGKGALSAFPDKR